MPRAPTATTPSPCDRAPQRLIAAAHTKLTEAGASTRRLAVQAAQEQLQRRALHVQLCAKGVAALGVGAKETEQLFREVEAAGGWGKQRPMAHLLCWGYDARGCGGGRSK